MQKNQIMNQDKVPTSKQETTIDFQLKHLHKMIKQFKKISEE